MRNRPYRFLLVVQIMLLALAGSTHATPAQTRGRAKQGGRAPAAAAAGKPAPAVAAASDIKIRVRMTIGEQSFESVEYVRGARQRTEMSMAGGYKTIMQCDLGRYVQLNDQTRTYTIQPFAGRETGNDADTTTQGAAGSGEAAAL